MTRSACLVASRLFMVGLLFGGRPRQLLSDDAAERQERPMALGLGKCLPESRQRDAPGWLRWARGGTERARCCRMMILPGWDAPGEAGSNPPASRAPEQIGRAH